MNTYNTLSIAQLTTAIEPPNELWRQKARAHLDMLTKPHGSLGRLEDLASQIVAIRQDKYTDPSNKAVYVFAADHGVTAEGVSAYPREVTYQMVLNFLREGAAINVLARMNQVELNVIDVGVDADFEAVAGLLHRKVAKGSRNMLREPAMSEEELIQAITVGVDLAKQAATVGKTMIALGEMGIGNTTSASAITCLLTGAEAATATGRGTGLSSEGRIHKIEVVQSILLEHFSDTQARSPLDVLRCVGGFEIAAMTGMVLTAARYKLVIVIDGFISTAAAALAFALAPAVHGYLIASHQSEEPGHKLLLDYLKLKPVLSLNMRLGEGTGAVLSMPILEAAIALYTQMATFTSANVSEAS